MRFTFALSKFFYIRRGGRVGRWRRFAKPLYGLTLYRGFESLPLRHPNFAPVAQWIRVSGYEPGGREFESLQARVVIKKLFPYEIAFFIFCESNE
jgi:hypothetical protein